MCAQRTHKEYIALLKSKHNNRIKALEKYAGADVKIKHRCLNCKHEWDVRPAQIASPKSKAGCPECARSKMGGRGARIHTRKTTEQYRVDVKKIWNNEIEVLGEYVQVNLKLLHQCLKCKAKWLEKPSRVLDKNSLKRVPCCSDIHNRMPTHERYIQELEEVNSTLRPLAQYEGRFKKIPHVCSVCDSVRDIAPKHLIKGIACFVCDKDSPVRFKRKQLKFGGREHTVQGFENLAIQILIRNGANPKKLITSVGDGKPTIKYRYAGEDKLYIPDIFHLSKNRIIEVKSLWTFGFTGIDFYRKNKAKAKACIRQGYEFKLMLLDKTGKRIRLPRNWYDLPKAEIDKIVKKGFT